MDIRRVAGQLMVVGFKGQKLEEVEEFIEDIKPAGLVYQSHNISSPSQVSELNTGLQKLAKSLGLPEFLIAITEEGGLISRFKYGMVTPTPTPMAVGVAGKLEYARRMGETIGRELRAMGFNWNFAPCLDVNSNPFNPIIGLRSFGEDPDKVSELTIEFIKGLEANGVVATGKHFPGHGDTSVDSHLDLPVLDYDLDFLMKRELEPFMRAIKSGLKTIMTAHIALPKIDDSMLPATLSRKIITGLLREKLGFQGVIITDSLLMKAVYGKFETREIVEFSIKAGCDILLMSYNKDFIYDVRNTIIELAEKGIISTRRIEESLARIQKLREYMRKISANVPSTGGLKIVGKGGEVLREVFKRSVKIFRDQDKIIPLSKEASIQLILPRLKRNIPVGTGDLIKAFEESFTKFFKVQGVETYNINPGEEEIKEILKKLKPAKVVVIGVYDAFKYKGQLNLVNRVLERYPSHIVVVLKEHCDALILKNVRTLTATYGYLPPAIHALAALIGGAESNLCRR